MPKKFSGENSKAVVAKARKEAVRQAEKTKKDKEVEDAFWADDDKNVARKQQRKDTREKKKVESLERKQENKQALEEEMGSLKCVKVTPPSKVTRSEIQSSLEPKSKQTVKKVEKKEEPIQENINRLVVDGSEARNIDEAISVLRVGEDAAEKHPEKRMKAAYQAYEELHLPRLKKENPNLRLSQVKQMLKKDWMKAPENPMNRVNATYNS